jgi:3-deoxy-manno-octulosonate cytidylyltransferase (CMP-KDO synthetase)
MIVGIIPARYGSTRFPGKPLTDIGGKPMIQRVLEQAKLAQKLDAVFVATDDVRIVAAVEAAGGRAVMTRTELPSGTDRCQEAYRKLVDDGTLLNDATNYVINIQGDEPFLNPNQIDELATVLDGSVELATQMAPVESAEVLLSASEVKIIMNARQEALYFSRQPIPYMRGVDPMNWHQHHTYHRHVGLYAYRADILDKITQLSISPLEQAESLEQLRWLEAGFCIKLVETAHTAQAVDEPDDVEKALRSAL